MTKEELQKLRDLPIEGVVQRLGLEVHHRRITCMFHADKHPSMYIDVKRNVCKCYSCGARAGAIDLVMKARGVTFCEAIAWLADAFRLVRSEELRSVRSEELGVRSCYSAAPNVDLPTLSHLITPPRLTPEAQRFLFDERHIHPAVVRWLRLSSISAPMPTSTERYCTVFNAPSLLIPYFDVQGRLLSVQARYLGDRTSNLGEGGSSPFKGDRGGLPRFQFPRGAKCHLYNMQVLPMLRDGEDLYVAEGPSDCMALLSAGHKAIAVPSATLLTPDVVEILRQYAPHSALHIYPDRDDAGEHLFAELAKVANAVGVALVRHELPEGRKDFSEYFAEIVNNEQLTVNNGETQKLPTPAQGIA